MNRISLCAITGNCSEYVERFIRSFAPAFDEVVLVRAIGNQTPDDTVAIAETVCKELGKPLILGEYKNSPEHSDWNHVDSFCAARNLSFDLATCEMAFWADLDDILESGAEIIRELAERGGYPVFMMPYRILYNNLMVPRERMIQRNSGRWQYPVHECFKFKIEPVQGVEDNRVVITHLPHNNKTGSNERNLRILQSIPEEEMTAGLWYHLQGELAAIGDTEGSVAATKKALACGTLGTPERYELFKNLARVSNDPNIKSSLLHQAYQTDPCRREALALLASNALDFGENARGLAYARQMMATTAPAHRDWTQRDAVYGWAGNDFYAQALRANGMLDEAEMVRLETLKEAGGPRIALLHATRGRPQQAAQARKLWLSLAERPDRIEHIFIFDEDDEASHCLRRFHHLEIPPGGGCVAAWNAGAFHNNSPIMVQMSDDWMPPPRWDELICERLPADDNKVLAINDGHRTDQLLCMAIITRKYLLRDCYIFHPRFKSMYSDNWFTHLAYQRDAVIEARDFIFTHNHPAFGNAIMDVTYAQQNAKERYVEGEAIYKELIAGNDWSSVPGFFDYWSFYQHVANKLQDGDSVAEVGVWLGRSIIFLAQALQRLGKTKVKLFAVDHFKGESNQKEHEATVMECGGSLRAGFEANLKRCGVADMVQIIDGDSAESASLVADGSLAFCYIDAAHDEASVKRDLLAWQPKVKPGGLLAGHDADWPEVRKSVSEMFPARFIGSVWIKA